MNSWNMLLEQRRGVARAWQVDDDMGGFQFMANSTSSVINNLRFAVARQVRSMFLILAGFNIAMALVLAFVILRNCYKGAKWSDPSFRFRPTFISTIEIAEIFPFVLSIGIIIQGVVYVVSQARGLEGLLILGCTSISQAMFPALFLVPYIQLLFGLETTVQALRRRPFPRSSRWATLACLLVVVMGIVGMYMVTRFIKPPDFCYASLFWFVQTWRLESFALLTAISGTLIMGAIIIFVRLHQDASIGVVERVAASRMVYYMILGAILNGLMAPFFFSISSQDPLALTNIQLHLHMVASVASNVSGITFGVLYIFLRSHKMQRIGPLGQVELGGLRKEKTIDSWPSTDIFNMQIEQPVSPARIYQSRTSTTRSEASEKTAQHVNGEKYSSSLGMVRAAAPNGDAADGSHVNGVPLTPLVPRARKDSYSLFPSQRETLDINPKGAAGILPCTTYTPMGGNGSMPLGGEMPEEVLPPPTIRISGAFRQNRYSSLVSSATVQIGLRVSNLSDVKRLEAPFSSFPDRPFSPGRPSWPLDPDLAAEPPNAASSSRPNGAAFDDGRSDMAGSPIRAAAGTRHGQTAEAQHGEPITLSPTVYSPKKAATPPGTRHHHRGVVASNPPSPGVAMTNDRQLVGTAQWI